MKSFFLSGIGFLIFAGEVIDPKPICASEGGKPTSRRESVLPESDFYSLSRLVGRLSLEVPDPEGGTKTAAVCTVLVISQKHVLTAKHCFQEQTGGMTQYISSYITVGIGEKSENHGLKHVFAESPPDADLVVIEIENSFSSFQDGLIKFDGKTVADKQDLFLLHYPGPGSVVLTRMDCKAGSPSMVSGFLTHVCDTEPGSSGGPIFDGKFHFVGMHLQGGRTPDDPSSVNRGLSADTILAKSPLTKDAFSKQSTTTKLAAAPAKIEMKYESNVGITFFLIDKRWTYTNGDDVTEGEPLVEQGVSPTTWTFWRPKNDLVFRWPKTGGDLYSRSLQSGGPFTQIGKATRTIP